MAHPLVARLAQGIVLADGAMGTMLYAAGTRLDECFDALNLTQPAAVAAVHRAYIAAGAELIETNTFGANRFRLEPFGMADRVREINRRGVKLAREEREISGTSVMIAGSIGPTARTIAPIGTTPAAAIRDAFREQIDALLEAGVDALMIETIGNLDEMTEAVLAAREACDLPIVACMTFAEDGRTLAGNTPAEVVARLVPLGLAALGANCSVGPQRILSVMHAMGEAVGEQPSPPNPPLPTLGEGGLFVPSPKVGRGSAAGRGEGSWREATEQGLPALACLPNAGWPAHVGGRVIYPSSPEYFAHFATQAADAGVRLIGGCCGTTPEHIQRMRAALDQWASESAGSPRLTFPAGKPKPARERPTDLVAADGPTQLAEKLGKKFFVSVEIDPPKGLNPAKALDGARLLKEVGVDAINVADSPMARVRMSALTLCYLIQHQVGVETIMHFTTRDRSLMGLQSELLGAHAVGVRNIIALTGDPPSLGDYPDSSAVYDIDSIGLIRVLNRMNEGIDSAGASIGRLASFTIACAVDPTRPDLEEEAARLRRKMEAGAHLVMTQPIFDAAVWTRFLKVYGADRLPLPLLIGILPLQSSRHAEFLHNEVPGITLSDSARDRMRRAGSEGRKEGVKMAQELLLQLKPYAQGVYIMPSFGRYEVAAEVMEVLR